jgi:hypothetical protein
VTAGGTIVPPVASSAVAWRPACWRSRPPFKGVTLWIRLLYCLDTLLIPMSKLQARCKFQVAGSFPLWWCIEVFSWDDSSGTGTKTPLRRLAFAWKGNWSTRQTPPPAPCLRIELDAEGLGDFFEFGQLLVVGGRLHRRPGPHHSSHSCLNASDSGVLRWDSLGVTLGYLEVLRFGTKRVAS